MNLRCAILLGLIATAMLLRGCGSRTDVSVAVENKTGVMIRNCVVRFAKGELHTGLVLTNTKREFSYFTTPISESAAIDVEFANNTKKQMKVYIGSRYDPERAGTLVFEIAPDAARVLFVAKN